jgi:signal transduction histidine kinase/CheY-like chemotaxis protein
MWGVLSGGETWQGRIVNRRKDGNTFTEAATISPVFDVSGSIVNYVAVKRDITENILMEEEKTRLEDQYRQAQKVESIGRLAGGVAHDLNNLLVPILGYGEILLNDFGPGDNRRARIEQIVQAGLRARDLVRQLLAFSRKQNLEYRPIDLNAAIRSFEKLLRSVIREDIELEFILSPEIRTIMADIGQLEQVILNLSVNAGDAISEGGRIVIETRPVRLEKSDREMIRDLEPGEYVMMSVSDTGCGMSEEVRSHIFEPFYTTKGKSGTGLGLSSAYGIVKQHGGGITFYSEAGIGTTFKVYLPAAPEAESAERENTVVSSGDLRGEETILLVEDDNQVRGIARDILIQRGYTVLAAKSGEEALVMADHHKGPIDLLLTDVIMPGMNGRELYERMAVRIPGIGVLYMSGYTGEVITHRGILDEGVEFIQKPFTVFGLANKVREALERGKVS